MLVMNMAEGARAVGNSKQQTTAIPKTAVSYTTSYFTANTSGATSANVQCSPSNFFGSLKANTLANTPAILLTGLPIFHTHQYTQFNSGTAIATGFRVQLYAGNTVCANSGATVYPPNTSLQRVIVIADQGSDAGGNTWGGYTEWDVGDATVTKQNLTGSGFANTVIYAWNFPGGSTSNTGRPWRFDPTAGSADIGNITIIYQH
jgi:hypothetical protein